MIFKKIMPYMVMHMFHETHVLDYECAKISYFSGFMLSKIDLCSYEISHGEGELKRELSR